MEGGVERGLIEHGVFDPTHQGDGGSYTLSFVGVPSRKQDWGTP